MGEFMMKHLARTFIFTFLLLALFIVPVVSASSPNYDIIRVEVNDLDITNIQQFDVERDEILDIEVWIAGDANITGGFVDDVRVEVEIIGYEFGVISDITSLFSIDAGVTYKKTLSLHVPDDIDSSEVYTLRVRVSDKLDEEEMTTLLNIDEQRHSLSYFGIILTPTTVQAGRPVFGKVRLENLGEKEENDIQVTMSIPKLGVSESGFIPELVTQQQEEEEEFFEQQSSDQIEFLLRIPEDAPSGQYTVQIDALYNRGHSQLSTTRTIMVEALPQSREVETIINPETTSKTVQSGEETSYRIMIANLGTEKGVYSVQLDGVQWAETSVEPGFLTVMPDSTGELVVFVTPFSDAEQRTYTFNARVMLGTEVLSDVILQAKVEGEDVEPTTTGSATFKTVLAIIFAVLVVVLIILGLVIALRKTSEDDEEAPAGSQTYYYSPKK
jgi:uncharacterized membrane protein